MYRLFRSTLAALTLVSMISLSVVPAAAQAVTHSYFTDNSVKRGMIVKLSDKDKTRVEPLSENEAAKMEGVVVAANDAPVTLSTTDASQQQVFVATTGRYELLVSNQNGTVKSGDYLTISSLAGVGMRADTKQPIVAGKALAGFDGKSNVSGTATLKDTAGNKINVAIGLIPVDINISHNPLEKPKESKIPVIGFLQSGAKAVTGKEVDPSRLYIGLAILAIVSIISGSILYGGVRSSMASIGRNPLAKSSIIRGLFQVVLVSVIIFVIGLFGVYLVLKL